MTPLKMIVLFLAIGVCFVPTGTSIYKSARNVRLQTMFVQQNVIVTVTINMIESRIFSRRFLKMLLSTTEVTLMMSSVKSTSRTKERNAL